MDESHYQFEWDEIKASANASKHGISFEIASTIFADSALLTVADLEHDTLEERWFSVGLASDGKILSVSYLWSQSDPALTKVRLISARRATPAEISQYQENL